MNRRGPWEGYRRQAKPIVSFPPSFARTVSSKETGLGRRQRGVRIKRVSVKRGLTVITILVVNG